jgi:prepilin-type N-terminal cleavage/methylation domain-containing protein
MQHQTNINNTAEPSKSEEFAKTVTMRNTKWNRGFTLVELLIVITVIGILYGISVPVMGTMKANAQARKKASIDTMVAQAKIRYVSEHEVTSGQVPTFAEIAQFITINGAVPATASLITDGTLNGTGQTITAYGTYPDPATGSATPLTWAALGATPAN